jgi:hypothetical protein
MSTFRKNEGRISGTLAEEELFGEVLGPIKFEWLQENRNEIGPLNYERTREMVKKLQPWPDAFEPGTAFADELHMHLAQLLTPGDWKKLRFYTAVHHYFDYLHGVDAFFELDTEVGTITVTLDASKKLKEEYKADVLVHYPQSLDPTDPGDKKNWQELMVETCSNIYSIVNDKKEYLHEQQRRR